MNRVLLCRVLAAAALLTPAALASGAGAQALQADPSGPATLPAAATSTAVSLELTSVSPSIVHPGQPLVIAGTVNNDTAVTVDRPVVRVVLGPTATDRAAVVAWATATGPAEGKVVGQTRLTGTLAPGASGAFSVRLSGMAARGSATYGALPLSVESGPTSVRTFAGYQRIKQYQPMAITWAVPLTLDPDPDLWGSEGAPREAAWDQALGAGSRVSRVLDATQDAAVTWAVDPTLTPSLLADPIDVGRATQEQALRTATETRIRQGAALHTPWVMPDTDADISAVEGSRDAESLMSTLVRRARPVAFSLGGRADIAWPADAGYTTLGEAGLRRLYRAQGLGGQVTAASALGANAGGTPGAAQRSASGLPLLVFDDALSALLARTTSPTEEVLSAQQFIADSAALLNELPGTEGRSVFVVAPRSFNPDPEAARRFFAATASIPWLSATGTQQQIAAAKRALPTATAPVTRSSTAPSYGGEPVLTGARVAVLERTLATVHGVAEIRVDGDQFARTWSRAAEQLASTRWRGAPTAWNTLAGRVAVATMQTTRSLKVSAGTINFLAESGRLQITVVNDLEVPVKNVKLTVEASNPRLRIDSQPSVLHIGPKSRATVNVSVTALAAGLVPLRTTLTTPDGTVIGQGADVLVRVTPTGNWVYWALGGVALAVLLLGVVRTVRRRPARRRAAADRPTTRATV